MREILFRAKSLNNCEWVYGYLVPTTTNCYIKGFEIIDTEGIEYDELDYYNPMFGADHIDPATVGQYIGITDTKGNKIFEGDVLESIVKKHKTRVLLVIRDIRKCTNTEMWVKGMKYAVIGNIHDNPELKEAIDKAETFGGLISLED